MAQAIICAAAAVVCPAGRADYKRQESRRCASRGRRGRRGRPVISVNPLSAFDAHGLPAASSARSARRPEAATLPPSHPRASDRTDIPRSALAEMAPRPALLLFLPPLLLGALPQAVAARGESRAAPFLPALNPVPVQRRAPDLSRRPTGWPTRRAPSTHGVTPFIAGTTRGTPHRPTGPPRTHGVPPPLTRRAP